MSLDNVMAVGADGGSLNGVHDDTHQISPISVAAGSRIDVPSPPQPATFNVRAGSSSGDLLLRYCRVEERRRELILYLGYETGPVSQSTTHCCVGWVIL